MNKKSIIQKSIQKRGGTKPKPSTSKPEDIKPPSQNKIVNPKSTKKTLKTKVVEMLTEQYIEKFNKERMKFKRELKNETIKLGEEFYYDMDFIYDILKGKKQIFKQKYSQYDKFEIGFSDPFYDGDYDELISSACLHFYGIKIETDEEYEKRKKIYDELVKEEKIRKKEENKDNEKRKIDFFTKMAKELGFEIKKK